MKKVVFLTSLIATGAMMIFRNSIELGICSNRDYDCIVTIDTFETSLYIFVFVLFFSVITYKAPSRIFSAWWSFVRFALPVILFLTILINLKLHHSPGGWGNMDYEIDMAAFGLMYLIFTLGSLIQIIRGYRRR